MQKIYCGSAKAKPTKYWEILKVSFWPKDLEVLIENKNEKWWVNLNISERKEVWKYGETHSVTIDDWKPEEKQEYASTPKRNVDIPDIPF